MDLEKILETAQTYANIGNGGATNAALNDARKLAEQDGVDISNRIGQIALTCRYNIVENSLYRAMEYGKAGAILLMNETLNIAQDYNASTGFNMDERINLIRNEGYRFAISENLRECLGYYEQHQEMVIAREKLIKKRPFFRKKEFIDNSKYDLAIKHLSKAIEYSQEYNNFMEKNINLIKKLF